MSYYSEACQNIDKKINDMASQLVLAMSPQNHASIKARLGKYLNDCTEVVDYLAFENTGLIDDSKRTIIKELISSSIIDMPMNDFLDVLTIIMGAVNETKYMTIFLKTPCISESEESQNSPCSTYYILPACAVEEVTLSLIRKANREDLAQEEYMQTSKWKQSILKNLDAQTMGSALKFLQVPCDLPLFSLLSDIDKRTKLPVWIDFLTDAREIPYVDDFLRLIIFTQFTSKKVLTKSEMEDLAQNYVLSLKGSKSL